MDTDASVGSLLLQIFQTLLDRVLVRTGESSVNQVARIGLAGRYRHTGAILHSPADLVQATEIDLRVDALGVQVHAQGHQVDVAGALTVTE